MLRGVLKLDTRVVAHLSQCTEEIQIFKRGLYYYSLVKLFGSKEVTRQNKEQTDIPKQSQRDSRSTFFPLPLCYRTSLEKATRKIKERLATESSSQC